MIVNCDHDNLDAWLALRSALWPTCLRKNTAQKCAKYWLRRTTPRVYGGGGWTALSLALLISRCATIMSTVANRRRVAFLEDLYRRTRARRQGWAARLIAQVQEWAKQQGCSELASDTDIANPGFPTPACGAGLC